MGRERVVGVSYFADLRIGMGMGMWRETQRPNRTYLAFNGWRLSDPLASTTR